MPPVDYEEIVTHFEAPTLVLALIKAEAKVCRYCGKDLPEPAEHNGPLIL